MTPLLSWNEATTAASPAPGVAEAMQEGLLAPAPGRGASGDASSRRIAAIRSRAAALFRFPHPDHVVFTPGCTHGLNMAVLGAVSDGSRVITTELEHNAVRRPLLRSQGRGVEVLSLAYGADGRIDLAELEMELARAPTNWLAITLASNVFGTIQPVREAAGLAAAAGARVLLDAAQGGGILPLALDDWQIDLCSVAGHKALRGPRGTGLLFVRPGTPIEPVLLGGTGTQGALEGMPAEFPTCLEPGTPNLPGIYGLGAALDHLAANPVDLTRQRSLCAALETRLRTDGRYRLHPEAPPAWSDRLPVLALTLTAAPPSILTAHLLAAGLDVRGGLLCAPGAAGIGGDTGILRLSPHHASTEAEFKQAGDILLATADALA